MAVPDPPQRLANANGRPVAAGTRRPKVAPNEAEGRIHTAGTGRYRMDRTPREKYPEESGLYPLAYWRCITSAAAWIAGSVMSAALATSSPLPDGQPG